MSLSKETPSSGRNFFDSLVLISNSVPKSGSTLLFSMQASFLCAISGKNAIDYSIAENAGVENIKGYVQCPHDERFLSFISQSGLTGGPYVFKTHCLLNARLRDCIFDSSNVYASLAIRNPVDVFFSARDNFLKTGEFEEFSDEKKGLATIGEYFSKILISSLNTSRTKTVPIVRYERIIKSPLDALRDSFHKDIQENVLRQVFEEKTNINESNQAASGRRNIAGLRRPESESNPDQYQRVQKLLFETTKLFGYD